MHNTKSDPKIIIILGMHRSGTSLVAQLTAKWGAFFGDDLLPPNAYNTRGYLEHSPLVTFHDKLLQKTNNKWFAPNANFDNQLLLKEFGNEARHLVSEMDQNKHVWCWKDPRMPIFLEFWEEILLNREILYIIPYRHPLSIATSLLKRDQIPLLASIALWELTSYKIFNFLSKKKNFLFIDYEDLTETPQESCRRLMNYLDEFCTQQSNPLILREMINTPKKVINTSWPASHYALDQLSDEVMQTYKSGQIPEYFPQFEKNKEHLENLFVQIKKVPLTNNIFYYAQLYLQNNLNPLSEPGSVITFIPENPASLSFKFKSPFKVNRLIFHPLNVCARVQIHSFQFMNRGEEIEIFTALSSNAIYEINQTYLLDTCDPQVLIDFIPNCSIEIDEVIINLDYLNKGPDVIPFLNQFNADASRNKDETIKQLQGQITERIHEVEDLKQLSLEKGNIIREKEQQFEESKAKMNLIVKELEMINKSASFKLGSLLTFPLQIFHLRNLKQKISNYRYYLLYYNKILQCGLWDEANYLQHNPDVKASGISAIKHYIQFGGYEGRKPSEAFDSAYYLKQNPDVRTKNMNPLIHYILYGKKEGRHPLEVIKFKAP